VATKIRNTARNFHAPVLPNPPAEYSQALTHQRDTTLRIYFQNIDDAITQALQYDTSDIIDGSIPNSKLENSTVSFGGVTLSLGGSDATPAFDLSDATGYPTSSLVGTITNAQLAGSIANAKLVNDSVSYGGVSLDLGQTDATPAFDLSDATNYPTSSLSGTITNAQLAGSIANAKLSNSTVSYGGIQLALGASDATPAFNLSDATDYPTSSLSGTITNAQLAGSIANAKLANDSVNFGGVTVALGASDTTPAFNLSDATDYPTSSLSGTIATAQIADDAVTDAKLADAINSAITANTAKVTNATHTGEVTGATALTIADNVVDEANLKVSNSPTNGYFLSAQSGNTGGLTWAQVSGGIAAVVDDTTPELGGTLDAGGNDIKNVDQLSIGTSTLTYDLWLYGTKSSEEGELFRITNTNTSTSADGRMITFYSGSNHRGSLGYTDVAYGSGTFFAGPGCGLLATTQFSSHIVRPVDGIGDDKDNAVDLGSSSVRFDDVYATNGTIQTSDRNLKQDIAELSDAEKRVAVAAKGLLRKYRWIDAVAEKGDNARIHFGIIAQDLEDAFTAEGLDAGRYAMFISTTWWEHEGEIYNEQAHIPEGVTATEVTRRGVRYPELLAFIISAL
jgi:hypothetical protein